MTKNTVLVKIDAGLEWDKAVEQTVELGLSGLEALSWIPGLVGASPVQNIGAYGSEAKDTISTAHTYDTLENKFIDFKNEECEFEYRNSIFKKNPGRYFIYAVTFTLSNTLLTKARPWICSSVNTPSLSPLIPQYKDVISYFESRNISSPTLKEIREAIIEIRKAKLPNPTETPNAGSYFGNPIISKEKADELFQKFPDMPMFDFGTNKKLFAGWLIDKAGLKGYEKDNFNIHKNHALVIIGNGKGTLEELIEFENYIKQKVFKMFGVELEREPVVVE
jgi:UDP-N-acetylmuramate dehydrogenase